MAYASPVIEKLNPKRNWFGKTVKPLVYAGAAAAGAALGCLVAAEAAVPVGDMMVEQYLATDGAHLTQGDEFLNTVLYLSDGTPWTWNVCFPIASSLAGTAAGAAAGLLTVMKVYSLRARESMKSGRTDAAEDDISGTEYSGIPTMGHFL